MNVEWCIIGKKPSTACKIRCVSVNHPSELVKNPSKVNNVQGKITLLLSEKINLHRAKPNFCCAKACFSREILNSLYVITNFPYVISILYRAIGKLYCALSTFNRAMKNRTYDILNSFYAVNNFRYEMSDTIQNNLFINKRMIINN